MNPTIDIDPKERHAKGYDCEHETFCKFGKEIEIHDYVQAGKAGTEIKEIIQQAGGLEQLKRFNKELPTTDIEIDLNMNPIMANKIIKAGNAAKMRLDRLEAERQALEKEQNKKEDKGGEE